MRRFIDLLILQTGMNTVFFDILIGCLNEPICHEITTGSKCIFIMTKIAFLKL